jgi:predicted Rossmann fold flavoprotein
MAITQVIVIGGGASGMMAAGRAAECGADVLLLEKTPHLGNKLSLTGKGRCNITNQTDLPDFVTHFGQRGRFLYGAFSRFFVEDLLAFLHQRGVSTVVERGRRIFPASNDARQVVSSLEGYMVGNNVRVHLKCPVEQLLVEERSVTGVRGRGRTLGASAVILATGGASYPRTGSNGDGYRLAAEVGHHIVPVRPALVPLVTQESWVSQLQGLTLRNVQVSLYVNNVPVARELGDLLFTHFGVSGPTVLTLSKQAVDALPRRSGTEYLPQSPVRLSINLKPGMSSQELDQRLQKDLDSLGRRQLHSVLAELLPQRMIDVFLNLSGLPASKPGHQVTAAERRQLVTMLQDLGITVIGSRPIAEAIVTAGGVGTDEINPRTLESRLVQGLFFCGEVMDVDADTGGYNLQAAFSTGYLAGESAAKRAAAASNHLGSLAMPKTGTFSPARRSPAISRARES